MNKELIKKRFSKNLETYRANATIQKKMAEKLISFLPQNQYDNILEIGCGTGFLTELVSKSLIFKRYETNDIVEECREYIANISDKIIFTPCDIQEFFENNKNNYDLIISNAALQWLDNLEEFIADLYNKLNPNGVLLFSIFGTENFREIYYVLGKTLSYYSSKEWQDKLKIYSPNIDEEIRVLAFKTPKDILKHLQLTGVNAIEEAKWTKTDLQRFESGYNNFCSNVPTLTYNPIYIMIKK